MGFVVREGDQHRLCVLSELGDELGRWSHAVADEQDHRPRLEAADRFLHVAHRENCDSVQAQSLDRVLQGLGNALDGHDHRRRPRGRHATHLIFEQGPAGQRQERSKAA